MGLSAYACCCDLLRSPRDCDLTLRSHSTYSCTWGAGVFIPASAVSVLRLVAFYWLPLPCRKAVLVNTQRTERAAETERKRVTHRWKCSCWIQICDPLTIMEMVFTIIAGCAIEPFFVSPNPKANEKIGHSNKPKTKWMWKSMKLLKEHPYFLPGSWRQRHVQSIWIMEGGLAETQSTTPIFVLLFNYLGLDLQGLEKNKQTKKKTSIPFGLHCTLPQYWFFNIYIFM